MGDRLKGKVAIVTGAGSVQGAEDRPPVGNGKAAAIVYAREGALVLAVDRRIEAAEDTKRMIEEEGGICSAFEADVTRREDCRAIAAQCLKEFGGIDILHNNVGRGARNPGGMLEVDEDDWDFVMNLNLKSMFFTCQAVLPHMVRQRKGAILNISSGAAVLIGSVKFFIYTVSKAAVNSLTRCLALEFADKGIRANAIMIGLVDSPIVYDEMLKVYSGDIEGMRKERAAKVPMKQMGEPWDVAKASLFLVSDEAKYVTGQILGVDGGLLLTTAG